jgi:hypothetical protein
VNADVANGEQTVIHTYLRRIKNGVRVDVRVDPAVEEFFQQWGGGKTTHVNLVGNLWKPLSGISPLQAWNMMPLNRDPMSALGYDIQGLGRALHNPADASYCNISFLRLVGASKETVSFYFEDIVSGDGLSRLTERLREAQGRFYDQYLKPATFEIQVMTDSRRLE